MDPPECDPADRRLSACIDPDLSLSIEGQDLERTLLLPAHPRRPGRHAWKSQSSEVGLLGKKLVDHIGGNVAFDDVTPDFGRMARRQLRGYTQLAFQRPQLTVRDVDLLYGIAAVL